MKIVRSSSWCCQSKVSRKLNGDGNNDTWQVTMVGDDISILECFIYDRWGNQVYKWNTLTDPIWDGKLNGSFLTDGVYVYKLIYNDGIGSPKVLMGDVTLLR